MTKKEIAPQLLERLRLKAADNLNSCLTNFGGLSQIGISQILFIILLTSLSFSTAYAVDFQVALDVHVHDEMPGSEGFAHKRIDYLLTQRANHAFILSSSFLWKDESLSGEILETMKHTSELARENPTRLTGLCGIRLEWHKLQELTRNCLHMPYMRGLKLRMATGEKGITYFERPLTELLRSNDNEIKVILMHLPTGFTKSRSSDIDTRHFILSEVLTLVHLASSFPKTIFIVAHSFNNPSAVLALAKELRNKRLENIFLDISNVAGKSKQVSCTEFQYSEYLQAWNELGLDKIVFGSDIEGNDDLTMGMRTFDFEFESIHSNSFLSQKEKQQILFDNGIKLLRKVRPDIF